MKPINVLISLLVALSLVLTACSGPASNAPVIPNVPVAPSADASSASAPTGGYEALIVMPDGTMTPFNTPEVLPNPNPVPEPAMEVMYLEGDVHPILDDLRANGFAKADPRGIVMIDFEVKPEAAVDCGPIADQIVKHALDAYRNMDPNLKWAGAATATLERLFDAMSKGNVTIRAVGQSPDGNTLNIWFSWVDPVKQRSREIMLLIGEGAKQYVGTIFPMGEPNVVAVYGSMSDYVVKIFQRLAYYNPATGFHDPNAIVYFSKAAIDLIGGATVLGMGFKFMDDMTQTFSKVVTYWGGCLNDALQRNSRYRSWKNNQGNDTSQKYNIPTTSSGPMIYVSEEDAKNAARVLVVVTGVVIIVKVGACVLGGQCWVIFVPTPAG